MVVVWVYIAQLHSLTSEQPLGYLVKNRGRISVIQKSSCGEFSVTVFKFSLPWQQGSSEQSLSDTIKLADPYNPPSRCKHLGRISCTSWVIADFLLKIASFLYLGKKGMSEPNVTGIVELADPENHTIQTKIKTLSYIKPKLWHIFW